MAKILLLEDDINIAKSLIFNIEQQGLICEWVQSISEAKTKVTDQSFDLFVFDIGLPDGTGIELCRHLRKSGLQAPILFVTARLDEDSLVAGFEAGGTDYVKKPFSNRELMARITANLKRTVDAQISIEHKGLQINTETRQCNYNGSQFKLSRKHFDILYYLFSNLDRVVSRDSLLRYLGREEEVLDRTIDVHISQLRKKLKDLCIDNISITSVYGLGYTIEK